MARRRLPKTLADYVTIAISPVLIMLLVGSLIWFLLEVFYQGAYPERLRFILGMFVMAAVLIGRIAMEEGTERAALFAIPLGIVTMLAIDHFVEYPKGSAIASFGWLINAGLLGLTWWCAHKLTWDSTLIDETAPASSKGLLETAGLEKPEDNLGGDDSSDSDEDNNAEDNDSQDEAGQKPERVDPYAPKPTWWQRLGEPTPKPHSPGVWAFYFSLAALPVFGLGQLFLPGATPPQRTYMFGLLGLYVASSLGLLLTTSFLGLRRYLRQRNLQMPTAMAAIWLSTGAALVLGLLILALLLPLPIYSNQVATADGAGTDNLGTNRVGFGGKQTEDQNSTSLGGGSDKQPKEDEQSGDSQTSSDGGSSGNSSRGKSSDQKSNDQKGQSGQGGQASDDKEKSGGSGKQGKGEQGNEQKGGGGSGQQKSGGGGSQKQQQQNDSKASQSQQQKQPANQPNQQNAAQQPQQSQSPPSQSQQSSSQFSLSNLLSQAGLWLRWLSYVVAGLIVGYFLWTRRDEVLAILRDWLNALFHWWPQAREKDGESEAEAAATQKAFAEFIDPFLSGQAARLTPEVLYQYTYQALQAWGREHGVEHHPSETVEEFTGRVIAAAPQLQAELSKFATLYVHVIYGPGRPKPEAAAPLQAVWQALRVAAQREPVAR